MTNYLTRALVWVGALTISASVSAQDHTTPPEIVIQEGGNITNILTTTPSLKKLSALFKAIRELPPGLDPKVAHWINGNTNYLPPAFLYELSRRLMSIDKDTAMEWFAIARIRAHYDAFRCADKTSRQGILELPQIASEVARHWESHRQEYGQAGLKALARPDLFTDQVSPLWICIHGMRAVLAGLEKKALTKEQWFVPEGDWPKIKQELLASFTEYYRQQSIPQDDPIPASKLRYAVHEPQDALRFEGYAWLNGKELVIGVNNGAKDYSKRIDLFLWRPGSAEKLREIVRGTSVWCAGRGNVMYKTGRSSPEKGVNELIYQFGTIERTFERRHRVKGDLNLAVQVQDWSIVWSRVDNPYQQSPFNCQWVKNEGLSTKFKWLPLLGDGFLAFRFDSKKLTGSQPSVLYASNPDDAVTPLPIKWNPVLPKCVKYFEFIDAYFLSPCGIGRGNIADIKNQKCIPYWWLRKKGGGLEVEETCLPVDSVTENLPIMFPSKVGILRLISSRRTFHGPKIGGVYVTAQEGMVTKIFDAWIKDALMSPDGCLLALRHGAENNFNKLRINVIDVCSAQPIAKQ